MSLEEMLCFEKKAYYNIGRPFRLQKKAMLEEQNSSKNVFPWDYV